MGMADLLGMSDQPWEGDSGGSLAQVVNPVAQQASVPVAVAPEVVNERKGAWEAILANIQKDQNLQSMLMHAGAMLMQPMSQRQTAAGRVGQVVASSSDYLANVRALQDKARMQQEEHAAKLAQMGAQTEGTRVRTAQTEQEISQKAELFPETKEKLTQDLANAKTTGEIRAAEAKMKLFEADPERMARRLKLDEDRVQAQISASNASAANSAAHTRLADQQTQAASLKNAIDEGAAMSLTPEEQKALGVERLRGRGTPRSTLLENLDAYKLMFTKSSEGKRKEGESDADYDQRATDYALGAVKKATTDPQLTAAYKLMENSMPGSEDYETGKAYVTQALGGGKATTPGVKSYATIAEAEAAQKAGKIQKGERVLIGGKPATAK